MNFDKLTLYLDSLQEKGIPMRDCLIYQNHQPVYRHFSGYSDAEMKKSLNGTEIYFLYSVSKIFTCTAVLQLLENGLIQLDDSISKYLPAFRNMQVMQYGKITPAKNEITVRRLMSMQSGLDYTIDDTPVVTLKRDFGPGATTRQFVDAFAAKTLHFEPGTDYQYSLSHDVLGGLIEVVSGEKFGDYLQNHIMAPLGINNIGFERLPERMDRMCDLFRHNMINGKADPVEKYNQFILSDVYESGGAGLIGSAEEYILLLDALACGGVGKDGRRILNPETIELYRTPQLCEKSFEHFPRNILGYSYGLGVETKILENDFHCADPKGDFGWDSAGGCFAMVDPSKELSLFFACHVLNYREIYFEVHPELRRLTYECMGY